MEPTCWCAGHPATRVDFRAGRGMTGERGLWLDKPGRPHGQSWARRWRLGRGPGWRPGQAMVGPPPGEESPTRVSCSRSRMRFRGLAGWLPQRAASLLRPPASGWRPWTGPGRSQPRPLGPGTVSLGQPSSRAAVYMRTSVGTVLRVAGAFRMGIGQRGLAGTHRLASPDARGSHVTQVNGKSPLQRKSLKKKRRLRGLTAHGAPLLHHPWVGLLWPEPSSSLDTEPCLGAADYGGQGGGRWGLFWLRVFPRPRCSGCF